jgi:purine-binding chemotaxis protein CheW
MEEIKEAIEQQQCLTFCLAGEEYAINILRVKEIIELDVVTNVPKTPAWIRGVINLRGNVVPVVDLAVKFGMEPRPRTKLSCIIIVEFESKGDQAVMGIIADSVNQVIEFGAADVEPPPAFGTRVDVEYLLAMGKLGKKFALILDIDRVLSVDELLTGKAAASEVPPSAPLLLETSTVREASAE